MEKICPTCKKTYNIKEDEQWKRQCYDCYRNFRKMARIECWGSSRNNHTQFYVTHPSVTKEELDEWIKKKGHEIGWGAEEWNWEKPKRKLWTNYI